MQSYKKPLIFLIILSSIVVGAYFGYQYYFKKQGLPYPLLPKEGKELTEQEKLIQSITPVVPDQQKIFTDEEKRLIESASPSDKTKISTETGDEETQKLIDSITPKNSQ